MLHGAAPSGLFTLYQTRHPNNFEPKLAGGLNGLDGRAAGGANVIYNDHACALLLKAFNTLAHAMSFFGFAHQEAVDRPLRLRTDDRDRGYDRVCSQREPVLKPGAGFVNW